MKRSWLWMGAVLAAALVAVEAAGHRRATSQPGAPAKKIVMPVAGATLYRTACLSCHGPDGNGRALVELPNGALAPQLASLSEAAWPRERLIRMITKGDPPMPAWGNVLTGGQIRSLASYVEYLMAQHAATTQKTPKPRPHL